MKVKFNLITNLITLSLTVFLLICVVTAWYVTNTTVSANGIIGSTSKVQGVELTVKTYSLSASDNDSYDYIKGAEYTKTTMAEYGNISSTITALLVEIEYKFNSETEESYPLTLETSITEKGCLSTFDSSNDKGTSYLSNATCFYISTLTNSYVDLGEKKTFVNLSTETKIQSMLIQDLSYQVEAGYIYIVMDYDSDLINYLYNDLLQKTAAASLNSKINFEKDLDVFVRM